MKTKHIVGKIEITMHEQLEISQMPLKYPRNLNLQAFYEHVVYISNSDF